MVSFTQDRFLYSFTQFGASTAVPCVWGGGGGFRGVSYSGVVNAL